MAFNLNNLTPEQQAIALQLDSSPAAPEANGALAKLSKRYGNVKRSFLEKYKKYTTPALILSWVCNVASGAGLFWLVSMIFQDFPLPYGNYIIGGLALFGFEYCKREASDSFWDFYWMNDRKISISRGLVNFGLFAFSLGATLFGVHYLVTDTTPGAAIMEASQKPEAAALQASILEKQATIAQLQQENKAARDNPANYNSAGTFFYVLQTAEGKRVERMGKLEEAIATAEGRLDREFGIVNVTNEAIKAEWRERRDVRVAFALLLCLILEVVFEVCMGFLSLYDWKKFQLLLAMEQKGMINGVPNGRKISRVNGSPMLVP